MANRMKGCPTIGSRKRQLGRVAYRPRLPFFSSWLKTEAASFLTSFAVGFLAPESTLDAREDVLSEDCFLAI